MEPFYHVSYITYVAITYSVVHGPKFKNKIQQLAKSEGHLDKENCF